MDDIEIEDLVHALEAFTLPNECFRHRDHLRFTYYRLMHDGYPLALDAVSSRIERFARHHGAPEKFHLTLTQCWVRLVGGALADAPRACTFEDMVARHPDLLDKTLPLRYYSRERLFSDAARTVWLEPDLGALPSIPVHRGVAA